jgi:uncharacterized protein
MAEPELISLAKCPSSAWRNGAGSLRLIATHPMDGGADGFDWRISVAEVAQDSPFSAFPGYDRCIALIAGNGMVLTSAESGTDHALDKPLQAFHFAGEARIHARLIDGPLQNLSVLARRGRHRITLTPWVTATTLSREARAEPLFIHCVSGELRIDLHNQKPLHLRGGDLVLWRLNSPGMRLTSQSEFTQALVVEMGAP